MPDNLIRVFVDTDVVISSILSDKGAASFLLRDSRVEFLISSVSREEILKVGKRLEIAGTLIKTHLENNFVEKPLDARSVQKYLHLVNDVEDAHLVAGAAATRSQFLTTYNRRDFRVDSIKREIDTLVLSPGEMLQYLRSLI